MRWRRGSSLVTLVAKHLLQVGLGAAFTSSGTVVGICTQCVHHISGVKFHQHVIQTNSNHFGRLVRMYCRLWCEVAEVTSLWLQGHTHMLSSKH